MKTPTEIHQAILYVDELHDKGMIDNCNQEEQEYHRIGIDTTDLVGYIDALPIEQQVLQWQQAFWELAEWHLDPDGAVFVSLIQSIRHDVAFQSRKEYLTNQQPI